METNDGDFDKKNLQNLKHGRVNQCINYHNIDPNRLSKVI